MPRHFYRFGWRAIVAGQAVRPTERWSGVQQTAASRFLDMPWSTTEMPFRQILLGFFAAFVLAILAGFVWTWRPAIAPIGISDRPVSYTHLDVYKRQA